MCKWWRHAVLECRLLFGNPVFASLPVIYAILFAMNMLNCERSTDSSELPVHGLDCPCNEKK